MDWHGIATAERLRDTWKAFARKRNEELGCFLQLDPELAREDASPEGPLAGVPFGVKDNIAVRVIPPDLRLQDASGLRLPVFSHRG